MVRQAGTDWWWQSVSMTSMQWSSKCRHNATLLHFAATLLIILIVTELLQCLKSSSWWSTGISLIAIAQETHRYHYLLQCHVWPQYMNLHMNNTACMCTIILRMGKAKTPSINKPCQTLWWMVQIIWFLAIILLKVMTVDEYTWFIGTAWHTHTNRNPCDVILIMWFSKVVAFIGLVPV